MSEFSIITHLGLGDLILQSGLAVHFSKQYDKVYYPCRKRDYNSVRSFFLLQPKIEVEPIDTDSPHPEERDLKEGSDALLLGFYGPEGMDKGISFAENFYRQAGVDYSVRWDLCPIQEVVDAFYLSDLGPYHPPWSFKHDDIKRGFQIDRPTGDGFEIEVSDSRSSILSYAPFMHWAHYIEVIDGPFLHLSESIKIKDQGAHLRYHKYARPLSARYNDIDVPTRKKWTVLT